MQGLLPDPKIEAFVSEVFYIENKEEAEHRLPFYADGFPGIMYSESISPVMFFPSGKPLSNFILYGQTIEPISLKISGAYRLIVFKLYPFATRLLIGIDPKSINDECYNLHQIPQIDTAKTVSLLHSETSEYQIRIITDYILELVKKSSSDIDTSIKLAITAIIKSKGTQSVSSIRDQLFISERTFERRFAKEIGVTAKQFARIIQFNASLSQLKEAEYTKLTSVAYDNGFSDQSHFIKAFKKFTGATPKAILAQIK